MNKDRTSEVWEWVRSIGVAIILTVLIKMFLFEVFEVDGVSMNPTLANHEHLIVNKLVYRMGLPEPGDIVVFKYSAERDYIKRVIGVSGDVIEVRAGVVLRNGVPLEEPYVAEQPRADFGPVEVPPEMIFAMGDNRNNSSDSRDPAVGFISLEQVKGKAFCVIWPFRGSRVLRLENVSEAGR